MRFSKLTAVAVSCAVLASACGDDDAADAPSSSAPVTTADAPSSSAPVTTADAPSSSAPVTTADAPSSSAAVTTAATGAADGTGWDTILAAADEEGAVDAYTVANEAMIKVLEKAFEEEYPSIDLTLSRFPPADIEARVQAEVSTNVSADVFELANPIALDELSASGDLVIPVGPAFDDPGYDRAQLMPSGDYFGMLGSATVWAWNTDLVPDGIKSWDDFLALEPGLFAVQDPSISPNVVDFYRSVEEAAGDGWLEEAAAVEPSIIAGSGPATAALASGEIGAAVGVFNAPVQAAIADGAPIDFVVYDGALLVTVYAAMLADSPHPNAAQVYANWLVSEAAQQLISENYSLPFHESVETSLKPEGISFRPGKPVPSEEVTAFLQRFGEIFS